MLKCFRNIIVHRNNSSIVIMESKIILPSFEGYTQVAIWPAPELVSKVYYFFTQNIQSCTLNIWKLISGLIVSISPAMDCWTLRCFLPKHLCPLDKAMKYPFTLDISMQPLNQIWLTRYFLSFINISLYHLNVLEAYCHLLQSEAQWSYISHPGIPCDGY